MPQSNEARKFPLPVESAPPSSWQAPVRVLLVDDDPETYRHTSLLLASRGLGTYRLSWARTWDGGLEAMTGSGDHDLCLVDIRLDRSDGVALIEQARRAGCMAPIVVLTVADDQEVARRAMEAGADDYLVKGTYDAGMLERAIRYSQDRARAAGTLRESQHRYRALFDHGPDPSFVCEVATLRFLEVNQAAVRQYGYDRADFLGRTLGEILTEGDAVARLVRELRPGMPAGIPRLTRHRRADGTTFEAEVTCHPVSFSGLPAFLVVARDITTRVEAEAEGRFLAAIVESSEDAIISESLDGSITSWNTGAERLFGYRAAEIVGRPMDQLLPEERLDEWRELQGRIRQGHVARMESEWLRIDGASLVVAITMSPIRDHQGAILGASIIARDMTERTGLERQLRESQKMEAVGRLAGGIAHDFNNVLTAIIGISDLLLEETPENTTTTRDLQEIRNAAGRAADLTRQLLAFSRRQNANPRRILLSEVVAGLKEMLARLLGEDVRLEVRTAPDLGAVRMDPGQVEQILMNLVVNARDAMPDGGSITIETRNVGVGGGSAPAGRQVLLEVRDTGTGIDEATLSRIFEPFFTTKEQGKGTGLGLATVHGIVTQNEGRIMVASRPGEGTTFSILLPRLPDDTPDSPPAPTVARIAGAGCGTILVVEDEPAVRSLIVTTLQRAGCLVLPAAGAEEGLLLFHEHPGRVDLVLTDVVLRGENGKWLADRLAATHPGLPVVYMSGYTDDTIGHHGILDPAVPFIAKPFTPAALIGRIREILDPGRRDPGHGGPGTPPGTFPC